MSDFKTKMHQIRLPLGLCPADSAGGAYPDPLAVFKGPTSKGREGTGEGKGRGQEREGSGGEGRGGRGWKGKEGEGTREERGIGACTHWDFRKSAPMPVVIQDKQHYVCSENTL